MAGVVGLGNTQVVLAALRWALLASDPHGKVFGRPATIELDLVVYNGKTLLAEIKSSMSEADVHALLSKVAFYEEKEKKKPSRLMIISPMVHPKAQKLAQEHSIEVYSYPPADSFSEQES